MQDINSRDFNKVLSTNDASIVVFSAGWCGPCKLQKKVLDDLESDKVAQVFHIDTDIDGNDKITNMYGITAVPSLLIFFNGVLKEKLVGFHAYNVLEELIDKMD